MKKILCTALSLVSIASQASALSCLRPDVVNAFNQAAASDQTYVVLKGKFAFTPLTKTEQPVERSVDATFSGRLLTSAGFTQQVSAPVQIDFNCAGLWCAELDPNDEFIAFVENRDSQELVFEVGPCYELAFRQPTQEDVKRLENCAQGGACEPKPIKR